MHERAAPAPGVHRELIEREPGLPERGMDPGAVLLALLGHPNLCSRAWVTTQYDETVGADTVEAGEHGAAVLRVEARPAALVMATDACAAVASLDPYLGAALAVAECTRNVAVTGARPLGVTDCLNYGDPGRPEAFWAFTEAIRGVADACRALELPVTGGNVSFYNESGRGAIAPTAQIGVVGLLDDIDRRVAAGLPVGRRRHRPARQHDPRPGRIGLRQPRRGEPGRPAARPRAGPRAGPAGACSSRPRRRACWRRPRTSRGGGLAVAIAEGCIWSGLGAELDLAVGSTPALELFGEAPSRAIVSTTPGGLGAPGRSRRRRGVPLERLGRVGGDRLHIRLIGLAATGAAEERGAGVADDVDVPVAALEHAWTAGLPRALGEEA